MIYLGKRFDGRLELFRSQIKPTKESHGKQFMLAIGPFKKEQDAVDHATYLGYTPVAKDQP